MAIVSLGISTLSVTSLLKSLQSAPSVWCKSIVSVVISPVSVVISPVSAPSVWCKSVPHAVSSVIPSIMSPAVVLSVPGRAPAVPRWWPGWPGREPAGHTCNRRRLRSGTRPRWRSGHRTGRSRDGPQFDTPALMTQHLSLIHI